MFKLLVIEDNESDKAVIKFILSKSGYSIDFVDNPYDANERLNLYNYHLILLDWHLPQMSGIDYLRRLKLNQSKKDIPVIMISGKSEMKDIKLALKEGISDYVIKPIDPLILNNKISELLSKNDSWSLTQIPENFSENKGYLKEELTLVAISEVEIVFSADCFLKSNEIYNINFKVLNQFSIFELQIKINQIDVTENSKKQVYHAILIGLKEESLSKIRLLCRSLQAQQSNVSA